MLVCYYHTLSRYTAAELNSNVWMKCVSMNEMCKMRKCVNNVKCLLIVLLIILIDDYKDM